MVISPTCIDIQVTQISDHFALPQKHRTKNRI